MTLAIGFINSGNLSIVAVQFDRLAWLIVALLSALAGLALDQAIGLAPFGLVALGPALLALALAGAVLVAEILEGLTYEKTV